LLLSSESIIRELPLLTVKYTLRRRDSSQKKEGARDLRNEGTRRGIHASIPVHPRLLCHRSFLGARVFSKNASFYLYLS
jgi:hypothetical protein